MLASNSLNSMDKSKQLFIIIFILILIAILGILSFIFYPRRALAPAVKLDVPYISQAPDGNWISPWDKACEEASAIMIDYFYTQAAFTRDITQTNILKIVDWENKNLEKNADTDAIETIKFINTNTSYTATVKTTPRLEEIKAELRKSRPIIALVNRYTLYKTPPVGSKNSYHTVVITGFNDENGEFSVLDPADPDRNIYAYSDLISALHDLNLDSGEADGQPTVIFTKPK